MKEDEDSSVESAAGSVGCESVAAEGGVFFSIGRHFVGGLFGVLKKVVFVFFARPHCEPGVVAPWVSVVAGLAVFRFAWDCAAVPIVGWASDLVVRGYESREFAALRCSDYREGGGVNVGWWGGGPSRHDGAPGGLLGRG